MYVTYRGSKEKRDRLWFLRPPHHSSIIPRARSQMSRSAINFFDIPLVKYNFYARLCLQAYTKIAFYA